MENILNGQPAFKPGRRTDLHDENWKTFNIRTHDLRHTFCTMLYNAGIGLKEAQYIMGHADMSMTMEVYTHLDEAKRQSAANILTRYNENFADII
jgi:integrase